MPASVFHVLSATTPDAPGEEIHPSNWNSQHAFTLNAVGSEISGAFANGNGLSFGLSAGSITGSYTVPVVPAQTAFSFANANGVTFGTNGSTVTASVVTTYLTSQSNQAFSAQGGSSAFQTLSFANSQGVSFSNSNGSLVASVKTDYLTTARASNDAIGLNTAQSNVTWTANSSGLSLDARGYAGTGTSITGNASITQNSNGIQFNGSNLAGVGTSITGNASITLNSNGLQFNGSGLAGTATAVTGNASITLNSAGLSFNGSNLAGVGTTFNGTNISGSMTLNSNGLRLDLSGNAAGGGGGSLIVSDTATSLSVSRLAFTQSNGVTMTLSTAAGAATVIASHNGLTTARASNDGIGLNTAQTNVTWTVNSSGLSFNAGGYAGTGFTSTTTAGTAIVATNNTAGLSLAFPTIITNALTTARASNDAIGLNTAQTNVTWTVNSSGLSLNAGGYAGTGFTSTTTTGTAIVGTHNTAGLSLGVPAYLTAAGGGAGNTLSYWRNAAAELVAQTQAFTFSGSTQYVQPMVVDAAVSMNYLRLLQSFGVSNTTSIATTTNATGNGSIFSTVWAVIYTQGTGASSLSLQSIASASAGITQAWRLSANTTGSQWTLSQSITHPITGGTSQFTTGVTTSLTNYSLGSLSLTRFTGLQFLDLPLATLLPASNYWFAYGQSSATSTSGSGANFTQLRMSNSVIGVSQINSAVPIMGQVTNGSQQVQIGLGSFSTNAINTTASLALSNISFSSSNPLLPVQMIRQA